MPVAQLGQRRGAVFRLDVGESLQIGHDMGTGMCDVERRQFETPAPPRFRGGIQPQQVDPVHLPAEIVLPLGRPGRLDRLRGQTGDNPRESGKEQPLESFHNQRVNRRIYHILINCVSVQ